MITSSKHQFEKI